MGAMAGKAQYSDEFWQSDDGLKLHYRDYAGAKDRLPVICIPGLTRNARDFEALANRIAPRRRVICVNLRGRGESGSAKDTATYVPLTYLADLEALLAQLKLKRFVVIGTSLGGIMAMLLAASKAGRVAGALLNDIGPVIETAGLSRIRVSVGKSQSWPTWVHAARGLSDLQGSTYPDYDLTLWLAMAKRLFRLTGAGRIVPDYDLKIGDAVREGGEATELWPAYEAFGDIPITILRGALSDILSAATAKEMTKRLPSAKLVTVPGVGHAPALDEAASLRAIDAFLKATP
jgi:pimeloyl-ACP methyl ester carboxylesterase